MNSSGATGSFRTDKRIARLNAFWATLALGAFLISGWWGIPAFLFVDYLLRGFFSGRMSPIAWLSRRVVALLRSAPQPQWAAPKIFAAKLGCLFSLAVLLLCAGGADAPARLLGASFAVLTSLEAFAGYCVACQIHATFYRIRSLRGHGQGTRA
jgi:hypothetical protein